MAKWTAVLTSISDVDQGEQVAITFRVAIDGKVLYPNCKAYVLPDKEAIEKAMTGKMQSLKTSATKAADVQIGLEVTLDGI